MCNGKNGSINDKSIHGNVRQNLSHIVQYDIYIHIY